MKKKFLFIILLFAFIYSSYGNTMKPEIIWTLNPEQNDLEQSNIENHILFYKWATNSPVIELNTETLQTKNVNYLGTTLSSKHFLSMSIYNPFTSNNFTWISSRKLFGNLRSSGTYKTNYDQKENAIDFEFYTSEELFFEKSFKLTNTLLFQTNILITQSDSFRHTYYFSVKNTNDDISRTLSIIKTNDNLGWFWISDECYTKFSSYCFFQDGTNNTIYNYLTEEEIIFSNQTIIGYGRNRIVTSNIDLSTGSLNGIYVYDTNGTVLYKDSTFALTEILLNSLNDSLSKIVVFQGYFQNNCIILNLRKTTSGPSIPFCTVILDLDSNQVYISPMGYEILGVF